LSCLRPSIIQFVFYFRRRVRADRLKNLAKDETSFVSIVQLAQEETERKNMLRLAELQRAAISEEANRLESMDDFVCRIFGVAKEEVI